MGDPLAEVLAAAAAAADAAAADAAAAEAGAVAEAEESAAAEGEEEAEGEEAAEAEGEEAAEAEGEEAAEEGVEGEEEAEGEDEGEEEAEGEDEGEEEDRGKLVYGSQTLRPECCSVRRRGCERLRGSPFTGVRLAIRIRRTVRPTHPAVVGMTPCPPAKDSANSTPDVVYHPRKQRSIGARRTRDRTHTRAGFGTILSPVAPAAPPSSPIEQLTPSQELELNNAIRDAVGLLIQTSSIRNHLYPSTKFYPALTGRHYSETPTRRSRDQQMCRFPTDSPFASWLLYGNNTPFRDFFTNDSHLQVAQYGALGELPR